VIDSKSKTKKGSYVHLIKLPKQNFYVAMKNIEMSPTGHCKKNQNRSVNVFFHSGGSQKA